MSDDAKRDAWDARVISMWFEDEHQRAVPEDDIEILGRCNALWCGWEGDCGVVSYRLRSTGETGLHVLAGVVHGPDGAVAMLRERLVAYREAIAETEAFLVRMEQDRLMTEIHQDFEEIGSLGDGDEGEVIKPWGSGNVFTDLGLPDPEDNDG